MTTASTTTAVTAVPAAPSDLARAHFAAEFTFETDCWDVHDALSKQPDFVLLDVRSPALFARGQALAAERGLILADTKYEFGTDADGTILLADEIHTPDSSRYWMADSYAARFAAGEKPESFDKDFVRNWVVARCDPYKEDLPPIPAELIAQTTAVYVRAYETITGQTFDPPPAGEPPLERIRRNLARFF